MGRLGLGSKVVSLVPPCSLSPAWEAAGNLGTAKMYLGSGQTCPGVRLNFNIVNLSGKGKGRFGGTWLHSSCSHKTNVIFQVRAEQMSADLNQGSYSES